MGGPLADFSLFSAAHMVTHVCMSPCQEPLLFITTRFNLQIATDVPLKHGMNLRHGPHGGSQEVAHLALPDGASYRRPLARVGKVLGGRCDGCFAGYCTWGAFW